MNFIGHLGIYTTDSTSPLKPHFYPFNDVQIQNMNADSKYFSSSLYMNTNFCTYSLWYRSP